jgi:hypothetical protein
VPCRRACWPGSVRGEGGAGPRGPGRARGVGVAQEVAAWSRPKEEERWGGKEEKKTQKEKKKRKKRKKRNRRRKRNRKMGKEIGKSLEKLGEFL